MSEDDPTKKTPDAGPSAYDRMSLDSLKRELATEKERSVAAREAARDRLEEETKKHRAFPWGTLAGVIGGGLVVLLGVIYLLRASFPAVADAAFPDWVFTPHDAGPPHVRPDAGPPARPDAGPPAAPHGTGHGHTGHGHGSSSGTGSSGSGSGGLDLGATDPTDDPLEGL